MQRIYRPRKASTRWLKPTLLGLATSACLALAPLAGHAADNAGTTIAKRLALEGSR